jgi:hypothetical protein
MIGVQNQQVRSPQAARLSQVPVAAQHTLTSRRYVSAALHANLYSSDPSSSFSPFSFVSMSSGHLVPALPVSTDEKGAPSPPGLPPSYQDTAEAVSPSPAVPEPGHPNRSRCRYRRLCHFLLAALFVWFTGRYFLRHCNQRKFGNYYDRVHHWVSRRHHSSESC